MRSHGLGIGHQAVRGSLDNHDQPVEGVPVTPTVNSASVIDLRAYADPSVVPTLVLVDLQKEFLKHIESERRNSARTRNARLAAIHSFFRFLEYRLPSCLDQSRRIHAIPMKKIDEPLIGYLTHKEVEVLLNAPDPRTRFGI